MRAILKLDRTRFLVCMVLLSLQTSCTHPILPVQFAEVTDKIDIPVELVVTDAFREAKWEGHSQGRTWIGENLVHQSKRLTANVFKRPLLHAESGGRQADSPASRYVLEPKLAFIMEAFGVPGLFKDPEHKISIAVEWRLLNSRGELVWVETVHGEGVGEEGGALFKRMERLEERVRLALQDLFKKSQSAMLSSRVLRKLQ